MWMLENCINGAVPLCRYCEDRQRDDRSPLDFQCSKNVGYNPVVIFYDRLISRDRVYTRCFHLRFFPNSNGLLHAFGIKRFRSLR